jgi:Fe2+ transport system protein B
MSSVQLADNAQAQINTYFDQIKNNIQMQGVSLKELSNKNDELYQKQQIQLNQLKEIEDKEKLLLTRSRMLQISQDRNAYKKKIIYSLIAVIFAIFIFTLVMYVLFVRKLGMVKAN